MTSEYQTRAQRFRALLHKWPEPGEILESKDGNFVQVQTDTTNGRTKAWATAVIDEDATGWWLSEKPNGVKCMIDEKDHAMIKYWRIKRLRVVRKSQKGTCLICEVVR